MRRFFRKAARKIKSSGGMSIGEMLVSILLMLLSTSLLVTTVNLGLQQYKRTLSQSEANTLSSTLQSIMTSELAYTTEIHIDDSNNVTEFQSQNYAVAGSLSMFWVSGTGYGEVLIGDTTKNADASLKLLGKGSYPNNIGVKINSVTYDSASCIFTVKFDIGRNGESILAQTFQVINVNETVAVST